MDGAVLFPKRKMIAERVEVISLTFCGRLTFNNSDALDFFSSKDQKKRVLMECVGLTPPDVSFERSILKKSDTRKNKELLTTLIQNKPLREDQPARREKEEG